MMSGRLSLPRLIGHGIGDVILNPAPESDDVLTHDDQVVSLSFQVLHVIL